jgi:hypothetical protein
MKRHLREALAAIYSAGSTNVKIRQNGHIVISFYDASGQKHRHIMSISPSGNATKRYDAQLRHMLARPL